MIIFIEYGIPWGLYGYEFGGSFFCSYSSFFIVPSREFSFLGAKEIFSLVGNILALAYARNSQSCFVVWEGR